MGLYLRYFAWAQLGVVPDYVFHNSAARSMTRLARGLRWHLLAPGEVGTRGGWHQGWHLGWHPPFTTS